MARFERSNCVPLQRGSYVHRAQDDTPMEEEFDEIEKLQHQGINAGDIKVCSSLC